MEFPFIQQLDRMDCGPVCLQMISKYFGKNYGISYLREICDLGRDGASLLGIKRGAQIIGLDSYGLNTSVSEIVEQEFVPIILHWNQDHFVVLYKVEEFKNSQKFYISDPAKGRYVLNEEEFLNHWIGKSGSVKEDKGLALLLNADEEFLEKKISPNQQSNSTGFETLTKEISNHKNFLFQVLLGILLSLVLQVLIPFLSKSMFDYGIEGNDFSLILLFLGAQTLLMVSNIVVSFFRNWTTLYVGSRINISIISRHLTKLLLLEFKYFDRKNSGDIVQRINDNSRIEDFLTTHVVLIVLSTINLFVFEIVLVVFNYKLFLFFNFFLLLYSLWTRLLLKKIKDIDYQRFDYASKNQSFVIQLINGIQDIKLSNSINRRIVDWRGLREDLFNYNQRYILLKQIQDFGSFLLLNLSSMVIIAYISYCVINHSMTIGELVAVQYILAQVISPLDSFVQSIKSYNDAKLSVDRLNEIDDYQVEQQDTNLQRIDQLKEDIIFKNVSFSYPGTNGKFSIKDVDVKILNGKVNAIVGASGSGKTTLAKLILKMYRPQSGEINVGDKSLENLNSNDWRSITSSVMQDGYIFSDSIINNIILDGGEIDKVKLKMAIQIANIQEYIDNSPLGLYTRIGLDGIGLSQGQKQRLLIARCVYKNPQLIVFDEATNALDSINENIIYENLENFYSGKTVVTIAHRLSTIRNADQIIVFNQGSIVETGNHETLLRLKGYYYSLIYNQQFDNVIDQ